MSWFPPGREVADFTGVESNFYDGVVPIVWLSIAL